MPVTTVPTLYRVTNPGKETLSLAGLVNIPVGKTVEVNLGKFRPETNAVAVYVAMCSAANRGTITMAEVQEAPAVISLSLPPAPAGAQQKDTVVGGVERNRPSTGLGGAGNEASQETAGPKQEKPAAPKSVALEAVNRKMDQIHNPTEPTLNMGAKPAALDREAPPAPPAPVAPPPAPPAPPAPPPVVDLPPAAAPAALTLSDL